MASAAWVFLALVGLGAGALFLLRLRTLLRARASREGDGDGWRRAGPTLAAFALSLLAGGMGLGGALVSPAPELEVPSWFPVVEIGAEPLPEEEPFPTSELPLGGEVPPQEASGAPLASDARAAAGSRTVTDPAPTPPEAAATGENPTPPPTSSRVRSVAGTAFGVRVGVFRSSANADAAVQLLRAAGLPPLVVPRATPSGQRLYYVYAGPYDTRTEAAAAARSLRAAGAEILVVEIAPLGTGG